MGFYLENGFLDFEKVKRQGLPFNLLIGGRGIGKTFGCLENLLLGGEKFIFARRTEKQLENIAKPDVDPTIDINKKLGSAFSFRRIPGAGLGIYPGELSDDGEIQPYDRPVAICQALSTVGNLRGTGGGTEFKYIVIDEFIKLAHEKPFKGEDTAFFDLYESLNRNRELQPPMGKGEPPLQAFLLSNSNSINSPIIAALGLINQLARMQRRAAQTGEDQFYINRERGIFVAFFCDSPVSKAKANTALYRALGGGSEYSEMAVGNRFSEDTEAPDIRSRPIAEYRPLITVGEITIYQHKSNGHYYVNSRRAQAPVTFGCSSEELEKFSKRYGRIYSAFLSDGVYFEDFGSKTAFIHYFSY